MVSSALQLRNEVDNHCKPCASSGTPPQSSNLNVIDELRRGFIIEKTGHNREVNFAGPSRQENPLDFREKKWLTLLHERPNVYDPARMTNWLNKVLSFSEHEMDTSRNAQIPTFPLTISCIDVVHVPLVSPSSESVNDAGISVSAMERHNFGLYTQSSTSTLEAGFAQTTQESAKVASDIAEFDDFMDGMDTT